MQMTIFEAKNFIAQKIKNVSRTPFLDAEIFLQNVLGKDKTFILLNKNFALDESQERKIIEWTREREQGLAVAYIVGKKEFFGYDFFVNQNVLPPKPDTEVLVSRAVEIISEKISANENSILTVCDMCAGSGCIALSVLRTLEDDERIPFERLPQFVMVDISRGALDVAKKNAESLLHGAEISRVKFIQSNLFEAVPFSFDVILANPPYVPHEEARALLADGRGEPLLALDGDISENGDFSGTSDGLEVARRLALEAKNHLSPNGIFLMETGEYNADAAAVFLRLNNFRDIKIERDLEGEKRVVIAGV